DGQLPRQDAKRAIRCRLGARPVAFASGPAWLARNAEVGLLPLLLLPKGNSNRLTVLAAHGAESGTGAVQALLDAALSFDPAPWSCWSSHAPHFGSVPGRGRDRDTATPAPAAGRGLHRRARATVRR